MGCHHPGLVPLPVLASAHQHPLAPRPLRAPHIPYYVITNHHHLLWLQAQRLCCEREHVSSGLAQHNRRTASGKLLQGQQGQQGQQQSVGYTVPVTSLLVLAGRHMVCMAGVVTRTA